MKTKKLEVQSVLTLDLDGHNQQLIFGHPPGTFALTPASETLINAIIRNQNLLQGVGLDWGSGVGCLAIVAARLTKVTKVYGLEISTPNLETSFENAKINNVADKVVFIHSNSYCPYAQKDQTILTDLAKKVDFILANPPSSQGDDGFGFRREVLRGAKQLLKVGGRVFLNISFQYNPVRIENLIKQIAGYHYGGILYTTDWVPFDLNRADLFNCLKRYCDEEKNGGVEYTFKSPDPKVEGFINAPTAYRYFEETGKSPLTQWQTHLFEAED